MQSDPNLGTWKLNVDKSKSDDQGPRAATVVSEPWETDGVKQTATILLADGTRATGGFSAHYDGKDYKITGSPDFDTVAYTKRVDANTLEFALKNDGKVVQTGKAVVSNDGNMRTITVTGVNAKGQKVNSVMVYDKQ